MAQNRSAGIRNPRAAAGAPAAGVSQAAQTPQSKHAQQTTRTQRAAPNQQEARTATSRSRRRRAAATRAKGASRDECPDPRERVLIDSPIALLAAVPVLLGFEPANSMVVIGTEAPRAEVRVTMRYDLPDPPNPRLAAELALHAAGVLAAQRIRSAVAVGYGAADRVTPVAGALRELAPHAGITVTELLRTEDGRFWSYLCGEPDCCPPEGTPFDLTDHPVTRVFASAGEAGVLSSRAALAATVAPADGDVAELMHRATRKAEERVARQISRVARSGRKASARRLIATAGIREVATAIGRYRRGETVSPEAAAWLTVVLRDLRVRDDAWSRMLPEHQAAHLRLWTDLTRLARPGYVPAPASLLAFVAWQSGNGALANVALDRALSDDPCYSMARLLRQAMDCGAPPSLACLPMTPEEVAASYDALEAEADEEACDPDSETGGVGEDQDDHGDRADRVDEQPGQSGKPCDAVPLDG
jgi:hypothetical protein